jgi:hypothetical protein
MVPAILVDWDQGGSDRRPNRPGFSSRVLRVPYMAQVPLRLIPGYSQIEFWYAWILLPNPCMSSHGSSATEAQS